MPYSEVPIEYPPGMLPFVLAPTWLLHQLKVPLLLSFILLMLVADGLGLTGLRRLGRQWGSDLGAWLWVVALPLLGPIVLLGWTLCRRLPRSGAWNAPRPAGGGQRGRSWALDAWPSSIPCLLLPAAIVIAPRRRRFAQVALVVDLLGIAP
jgi:hypothetical protein